MSTKTAAMTPLKARAVEALAGLTIGGGAGAFLAGKTYQTKDPLYWKSGDQIYGRDMSKEEKKKFVLRMSKAAIGGGTALAAASLGISAIRRGRATAADLKQGREAFDRIFKTLSIATKRQSGNVRASQNKVRQGQQAVLDARGIGNSIPYLEAKDKLVELKSARGSAEEILRRLQAMRTEPRTYVDWARKARDHVPWGGKMSQKVHSGDHVFEIPSRMTAEGQMINAVGPQNITPRKTPDGKITIHGPGQDHWFTQAGRI